MSCLVVGFSRDSLLMTDRCKDNTFDVCIKQTCNRRSTLNPEEIFSIRLSKSLRTLFNFQALGYGYRVLRNNKTMRVYKCNFCFRNQCQLWVIFENNVIQLYIMKILFPNIKADLQPPFLFVCKDDSYRFLGLSQCLISYTEDIMTQRSHFMHCLTALRGPYFFAEEH